MRLKQLLAAKGIHYFVTRFGPARLRGMAFDEKYRRGDWSFKGRVRMNCPPPSENIYAAAIF
jgi:hypothetical protein